MNGSSWRARRSSVRSRAGNLATAFGIGLGGTTLGVFCLGLLVGLLFGSGGEKGTPEEQVSDQVDVLFTAMADGTFEDTYRNETNQTFREQNKLVNYLKMGEELMKQFGALQSKTQVSFERDPVRPQVVIVTYDGQFEKGPGVIKAQLRKSDKKWLFLGFVVDPPKKK